jgi:hypothetical protein
MKIGILPSSQRTSSGSGIGSHNERELMVDVSTRLVPKLIAAGHNAQQFLAATEVGSDGANALVAWRPQICIDLHLDSGDGGLSKALLCYQEERSLPMGLKMLDVYCKAMGYGNRGAMKRTPGTNGVAVIRIPEASGIPTALIELGSMDRPDGANWLNADHREKAAVAMAKAICAYAGGTPPQPKPKEDDGMLYQSSGAGFTFEDCYVGKYDYWMHTQGDANNLRFKLVAHKDGKEYTSDPQNVEGHRLHDLQTIAKQGSIAGSYSLICTNDNVIQWGLREVPK